MNFLALAGDGASYSFDISAPGSNITINKNLIEARSMKNPAFSQFEMLTNSTNATTVKNQGRVTIRNKGGKIEIS
jgi:hypothetical protein